MFGFMGKGWKTVTGALLWATGHATLVSTVLRLTGIHLPFDVDHVLQTVGGALTAVGVAHKIERVDPTTPSSLTDTGGEAAIKFQSAK